MTADAVAIPFPVIPANAGIQYAAAFRFDHGRRRLLDRPLPRAM